jgi:hypothetical protein
MKNLPLSVVLLSVLSLGLTGCLAVVAGGAAAGGVAYVRGELRIDLDHRVASVNRAIEKAGNRLELHPISADSDQMGGQFVFRNAHDDKITVTSTARTDTTTSLSIRVGVFGDQQKSQQLLDAIRAQL